jgi:hypothetical protein
VIRYVLFEGSRIYHLLSGEGETECGVSFGPSAQSPLGGAARVVEEPPLRLMPCKHCALSVSSVSAASGRRRGDRRRRGVSASGPLPLQSGDIVRVVTGPESGRVGTVTQVMRAPHQPEAEAEFVIEYLGGGETRHVGANLEKASAKKGGKK